MRLRFLSLFALLVLLSASAFAAPAEPKAGEVYRLPDRIVRPMRAIDPITLRAEGGMIRLWGIKPAQTYETPLELKALDLMDGLIQDQQVNCKVMGGVISDLLARCATQGNQDLALELLSNGYVVVDRRQTYDSVFATAYEKAQENARLRGRGVWAIVTREETKSSMPSWLEPHIGFLLPLGLIFGPFGGLLIVAVVLRYWFKRIADAQADEVADAHHKEAALQLRERQVLITTLEGELSENKSKIEAFLVIYGDMLRSLQDSSEVPKYQQAGDIIQKHPNFSKSVFEANVAKLSLLDIKLAGQISKVYSSLSKENEYINLDQAVPLDTAIKLVEKVMRDAEVLLDPINMVLQGLENISAAKA